MRIEIKNGCQTKASLHGEDNLILFYEKEYCEGDYVTIYSKKIPTYLKIKIDDAIEESIVYLKDHCFEYRIPIDLERKSYSYKAFYNKKHLIKVSKAKVEEIECYQNLARNTLDQEENETTFPHITSSLDSQLQHVFKSKNMIDGLCFNTGHGKWPYTSWSYMGNPNASFKLDFGRAVTIEKIIIYIRADFPHDSFFKKLKVEYSNHLVDELDLIKTRDGQIFECHIKDIEWIKFYDFEKNSDEVLFAALSQVEVYGYNNHI